MNTRISDAAVEAWASRHGLSSRTLRQAYEEAALPHMHSEPAGLDDSTAGHELAYAVEKALGNRDGQRDAELDELLAMAMNELNAINTEIAAAGKQQDGEVQGPND